MTFWPRNLKTARSTLLSPGRGPPFPPPRWGAGVLRAHHTGQVQTSQCPIEKCILLGQNRRPLQAKGPKHSRRPISGELPTRIGPSRHSPARSAGQNDRALPRMKMKLGGHQAQKRPKWPKSWEWVDHDATQKRPPRRPQTRTIKARKPSKCAHKGSNEVPPARKSNTLTVGQF